MHYKEETDLIYSLKALWRPASIQITEEQIADPTYMPLKEPEGLSPMEASTSQDDKPATIDQQQQTPEETTSE